MLGSSIGWILVASGAVTAGGGFAGLLFPHLFLRLTFGIKSPEGSAVFFVRHWGILILLVAALLVHSAHAPAGRTPILVVAAIEKFAVGLLIFFGPVKRTGAMTALAIVDGTFALLYVAYLAGS